MKLEFKPNAMELMLDVVREMRPELQAQVYFTGSIPCPDQEEDAVGRTIFPDDGSVPHIQVHIGCTIEGACEVLAHELAHLVVGVRHEDADHDDLWQFTFDMIYEKWAEKMKEHYDLEQVQG
jgi:hypothetical protein